MSAVVIVVTYSRARGYSIEGQYGGCFARAFGDRYEDALSDWRKQVGYWGEVKR